MPTFAIYLVDKPGSAELRRRTRPAHLAYIAAHRNLIVFGGPMQGPEGHNIGGLTVLDVPDLSAAETFARGDPYAEAGLFETMAIRPITVMVPGPAEIIDQERERAAG
jgi:uncharacterized protein YciI